MMRSSSIPGPSPRRFGVTLGFALLAIAAVIAWRGQAQATPVVAVTGGLLLALGVLAPRLLAPVLRAWMALGHAMGLVMTPVLFTMLWLVAFVPVGVLRRTLARSPLARDPQARSYWVARPPVSDEAARASMQRQF